MLKHNQKLKALRAKVREADYLYYVKDAAVLTDAEYDVLYQELVALEAKYPECADPNSPINRIGGLGSGFVKTKHERRMLSLQNTHSAQEVFDYFGAGEEIVVEPKVDGLSLKLIYVDGNLTKAVTRGNGEYGDDVTANARTIRTIPLVLPFPISIEVTGEVYMTYTTFNELNDQLEADGCEPFANVRNAASGTLKSKNPADVAARKLSFAVHGCLTEFEDTPTYYEVIEVLEGLEFRTMFTLPVLQSCPAIAGCFKLTTVADVAEIIKQADTNRKFLNLATDGLVFKINDLNKQIELGEGTKSPNWAAAFKFPPERKSTTLLGVTLQIGKTGRVTPVAELKPLLLGGTLVRRASLCNQDEINRLGVNIGDEVYVEKSAEIIPKIMGVAEKITDGAYVTPANCPCCRTVLTKQEGRVDLFCPNRDCGDQVYGRLRYATGKSALDIDGCGEMMIRELMTHGVRRLSDLFTIKDVNFLKPAAKKSLLEGREAAKKQPLWRQLNALGIDGIGQTICQDIAQRWTSLFSIFDELDKFKDMFGEVAYSSFIDHMQRESTELNALEAAGLTFESEQAKIGKLTGKTFAITGALMSGSRDEIIRRIESHGGMVKANVSTKCQYLVVGTDGGRVKAEKSAKKNVPCITEKELYDMMGEVMPTGLEEVDPDKEY